MLVSNGIVFPHFRQFLSLGDCIGIMFFSFEMIPMIVTIPPVIRRITPIV